MNNRVIIFIKNAVLGTVKTRLAKTVGDKTALKVYKDLVVKCREECLALKARRFLFYSKEIIQNDDWSLEYFNKDLQKEGDLGEKISSAFQYVFKKEGKAIIIGSDCYDLNADIMQKAFDKLNEVDLVLGPANDGGYYLLGTNKFQPSLFKDINWSTESVMAETIKQANKLGLTVALLEELVDLDTFEDLEKSGYEIN